MAATLPATEQKVGAGLAGEAASSAASVDAKSADAKAGAAKDPFAAVRRPSSESAAGAANPSKVADALTSAATPGAAGYKIGAQDVLEVSVFKVAELSKSVQVAEAGTINLPLVGEVQAMGKTAQDIEHDLTKKLGDKYLQKPQVTVFVKEYNSQRVTIEGAVKKPGVFPFRGKNSLLQYVAMAEGLDPNSDSTAVVFRQVEGKRMAARFDIAQIRTGETQDPPIQSGDVIVIGSSAFKEGFNNFIKLLPVASVFALL